MQIDDNFPWMQSAYSEGKSSSLYSHKASTEGVQQEKQARFSSAVSLFPQMSLRISSGLVHEQMRAANVLHE